MLNGLVRICLSKLQEIKRLKTFYNKMVKKITEYMHDVKENITGVLGI